MDSHAHGKIHIGPSVRAPELDVRDDTCRPSVEKSSFLVAVPLYVDRAEGGLTRGSVSAPWMTAGRHP